MTEPCGTILELWRYPVSSLPGETLVRAELNTRGIVGDRIWGVFDAETGGVAAPETAKRWRFAPQMRARTGMSGPEIRAGDGDDWLSLPCDAADAAASSRAGFPVAFAPLAETMAEATVERPAPRYDRDPLHILTTQSLDTLKALLPKETIVDVRRFRPNMVIAMNGPDTGFPERQLIGRTIAIGDARIDITGPCERCAFTALAQADLPFAKEVLHAISRHCGGGFGVLARVSTPAPVQAGDSVRLM